jgi:hypothetical protein
VLPSDRKIGGAKTCYESLKFYLLCTACKHSKHAVTFFVLHDVTHLNFSAFPSPGTYSRKRAVFTQPWLACFQISANKGKTKAS